MARRSKGFRAEVLHGPRPPNLAGVDCGTAGFSGVRRRSCALRLRFPTASMPPATTRQQKKMTWAQGTAKTQMNVCGPRTKPQTESRKRIGSSLRKSRYGLPILPTISQLNAKPTKKGHRLALDDVTPLRLAHRTRNSAYGTAKLSGPSAAPWLSSAMNSAERSDCSRALPPGARKRSCSPTASAKIKIPRKRCRSTAGEDADER
jgi:hypothetical protein